MNEQTSTNELPLEITVQDVKHLLDNQEAFLLIDCRENDENAFCRIDGSKLIPMNETPSRLNELEEFRESRIVIHCHHGGRSFQVTQWLRAQGFPGAQNMIGGIDLWSIEIDSNIPRY